MLTNRPPQHLPSMPASRRSGALRRGLNALWQTSTSNTVLLAVIVAILLLVVVALLVPQAPAQIQDNPATATRWLLSTSAEFGTVGALLRTLGLFNLQHSPLFHLLLGILTYLLANHAARDLGVALALRRLPALLDQPVAEVGAPLLLPRTLSLLQRRALVAEGVDQVTAAVQQRLAARFPTQSHGTAAITDEPSGDAMEDRRILAVRDLRFADVRPLLPLGLLLAVVSLWLSAIFGWDVSPPTIAPGDGYRNPLRDLALDYVVYDKPTDLDVALKITLAGREMIMPVSPVEQMTMGGVRITARADTPGIVVRTHPSGLLLARPGEPAAAGAIGLSFADVGGEESLLLPEQAIGIRLVRLPSTAETANPFMVEVYDADQTAAAQRVQRDLSDIASIRIDEIDADVQLIPVPGLTVSLRHEPAPWLLWLGLVGALAGSLGYLRRPQFVLAQVTPWPPDHALLTAQTQSSALLPIVHERLAEDAESGANRP